MSIVRHQERLYSQVRPARDRRVESSINPFFSGCSTQPFLCKPVLAILHALKCSCCVQAILAVGKSSDVAWLGAFGVRKGVIECNDVLDTLDLSIVDGFEVLFEITARMSNGFHTLSESTHL